MCELKDGRESRKIAEELLEKNILIKDLTRKIGNGRQYIRLAVRTEEENEQLVEILKGY
jgi:histidinol-phosphate/aromatic aminotransferase/cobyric acid decarboxylase-like protein